MTLKLATPEDLPYILEMAKKFAAVSPYKDYPQSDEKIEELILSLMKDRNKTVLVLYMVNDKPVGMIGGMVSEMIFSRDLVASELIWWVDMGFRSRKTLALKEAYEYWAKRIGAKYIQMSNLDDQKIERYYERTGYKLTERAYLKVIGE